MVAINGVCKDVCDTKWSKIVWGVTNDYMNEVIAEEDPMLG